MRPITLVLCAWIAVCSCRAGAHRSAESPTGTWTLTELEGTGLGALARPAELTIGADGTLAGFSGVNRFSGRVAPEALADGHLRAGPLVSTRMAGPPEAMAVESRLLALLGMPLEWRREGARLELLRDGAVLARLAAE